MQAVEYMRFISGSRIFYNKLLPLLNAFVDAIQFARPHRFFYESLPPITHTVELVAVILFPFFIIGCSKLLSNINYRLVIILMILLVAAFIFPMIELITTIILVAIYYKIALTHFPRKHRKLLLIYIAFIVVREIVI